MSLRSLDEILREAVATRASDIHLAPGAPALKRVDSDLTPVGGDATPLDVEWLQGALLGILNRVQRGQF